MGRQARWLGVENGFVVPRAWVYGTRHMTLSGESDVLDAEAHD